MEGNSTLLQELQNWSFTTGCKLVTVIEGDQKAPFSIATTPRCKRGRYSFPEIAPVYS